VALSGAGGNAASLTFAGDTSAFQIASINSYKYNQPASAGPVALALSSDVSSSVTIVFKANWIDNSAKSMTATLTDSQGSAQTLTFSATYIHPMQISSAMAWYQADAITGLANSDPVSVWNNSIASAPAAIQPDSNLQPTYLSDGINHLPSVYFYGDTLSASAVTTPGSSARTLVVLGQVTEPSAGNMLRGFAYTGSGAGVFELFNNYSDRIGYHLGSEGQDAFVTSVLQPSVYVMDYDGTDLHLFRNGQLLLTKTSFTLNTSTAGLTLGDYLIGTISELGLFSAALSTSDRQAVQCYLSAKYALGISCP
jgi:hypothetical protein